MQRLGCVRYLTAEVSAPKRYKPRCSSAIRQDCVDVGLHPPFTLPPAGKNRFSALWCAPTFVDQTEITYTIYHGAVGDSQQVLDQEGRKEGENHQKMGLFSSCMLAYLDFFVAFRWGQFKTFSRILEFLTAPPPLLIPTLVLRTIVGVTFLLVFCTPGESASDSQ